MSVESNATTSKRQRLSTVSTKKHDNAHVCNVSSILNKYKDRTDEQLLQWQESHLSRSIIDNTVNRVVESYIELYDNFEYIPEEDRIRQNNENNLGLEESAILMAITNHGLQQNESDQQPPQQMILPLSPQALSAVIEVIVDDEDEDEDDNDEISSVIDEENNELNNCEAKMGSLFPEELAVAILEPSQPSSPLSQQADEFHETDHFDFMEAAVGVAIQKKGLAPYANRSSPHR